MRSASLHSPIHRGLVVTELPPFVVVSVLEGLDARAFDVLLAALRAGLDTRDGEVFCVVHLHDRVELPSLGPIEQERLARLNDDGAPWLAERTRGLALATSSVRSQRLARALFSLFDVPFPCTVVRSPIEAFVLGCEELGLSSPEHWLRRYRWLVESGTARSGMRTLPAPPPVPGDGTTLSREHPRRALARVALRPVRRPLQRSE